MPLDKTIVQDSFRSGMFRGVARHLIPPDGCYDLLNYLLDDEDGSPYKRGGSAYLSTGTGTSPSSGAVGLWDGQTVAGERTFVMEYSVGSGALLWPVASGDGSLVNLSSNNFIAGLFPKVTEFDGVVVVGGDTASDAHSLIYAGTRNNTHVSTGTVSVAAGSRTLTGAGTSWSGVVDAGYVIQTADTWNVVQSVESNTSLTLRWPWAGAALAGAAYNLRPAELLTDVRACPEFVARRLCGVTTHPNRMIFSGFSSDGAPNFGTFDQDDYHEFPGRIVGIHALRDTAMVFTTAGLFAVRNLAFDLTDDAGNPQHTVEKIDGMALWAQQGVRAWGNALVVPARDGVYLVDGASQPVLLSRSISKLYRSYVSAGYRLGQAAIFRNTYLLPIVGVGTLDLQGWLTCKLDGSDDGRFWPWTRLSGSGVRVVASRDRANANSTLLGGGSASGARLMQLSWFDPSASVKNDADGTAPTYTVVTRDYDTGPGNRNVVKKLRVEAELADAASDDPTVTASYGTDAAGWSSFTTIGTFAETDTEKTWLVQPPPRTRRVRFRLTSSTAAASFVLRSLAAWVRLSGRD